MHEGKTFVVISHHKIRGNKLADEEIFSSSDFAEALATALEVDLNRYTYWGDSAGIDIFLREESQIVDSAAENDQRVATLKRSFYSEDDPFPNSWEVELVGNLRYKNAAEAVFRRHCQSLKNYRELIHT